MRILYTYTYCYYCSFTAAATNGLPSHPLLTLCCIQFYLSTTSYLSYFIIYLRARVIPFPSTHDAPCITPLAQDKELPSHGFLTGHRSVTAATTTVDSPQSTTYFSPTLTNVIIIIITILLLIIYVVVVNILAGTILLIETRRVIIRVAVTTARENAFVCRRTLSQLLIAGTISTITTVILWFT